MVSAGAAAGDPELALGRDCSNDLARTGRPSFGSGRSCLLSRGSRLLSGVRVRFSASLPLCSCILPLIHDIGPDFLSFSESEKTGSVLDDWICAFRIGSPSPGSVAAGESGVGSWKLLRGCPPVLLPTVDRDVVCSCAVIVPRGLPVGGLAGSNLFCDREKRQRCRFLSLSG